MPDHETLTGYSRAGVEDALMPARTHALVMDTALQLPDSSDPRSEASPLPFEHVTQLAVGHILSSALNVAVTLRLADRVAEGMTRVVDLARETGVDPDSLYRVMRLLASAEVFVEERGRSFAMTPAAEALRADSPASLHGLVSWLTDPFHHRVYADAMYAVITGRPAAERTAGMPVFEHFARTPPLSAIFNNAMIAFSAQLIPAILDACDFGGIERLVDVGGGHGHLIASILQRYPQMRGVLFDVDHVILNATPLLIAAEVETRCCPVSGDFFTASLPRGDAYVLKHILHDWDDEAALAILRNVRRAIGSRPRARLILLEAVIGEGVGPDFAKVLDVERLMMTSGRERTAEQFRALLTAAGFELTRIVSTRSPISVVEAESLPGWR
jgi:hypothetical protein